VNGAHARGIAVTNTPDVLTAATADLTMALILAAARRIVAADQFTRQGMFTGWGANLFLGKELNGAVMGVIGLGRIGLAVALRAKAFGMQVIYNSRHRKPELEKKYGFAYDGFIDLIQHADVVSLHLPYSADVHHLFNADVFEVMKEDAVFVNASRGGLMNEHDLVQRLKLHPDFYAALDVYEFEPKITEELKQLPNTVLAPHMGSATAATRLAMARMTIMNVRQALAGATPDHLVAELR